MKLIFFLIVAYFVSNIAVLAMLLTLELGVSKLNNQKCRFFQKQFWWLWTDTLAFGLPVVIYAAIKEFASKGE